MPSTRIVPAVRLMRGAAGTISHQFTDSDGEPAAPPSGTLAVSVVRSDGSSVSSGAIAGSGTDARTTSIAAVDLFEVDWLTATWTVDGDPIAVDVVEVVGGHLGTMSELRATDPSLNAVPAEKLLAKRRVVEDTALAVLGRSIFERFYVQRRDGTGRCSMVLAFPDLLEVAWVKVWSGSTSTSFTAAELAAIPADPAGIAVRTDGGVWPCGERNIEIGFRFGMRACPGDLLDALRKSVRHAVNNFDTGVPAFAASMQTADGFSIGIAGPGNEDWATGDVTIDRVVNRYKHRPLGIA